jgi:O-antigen/teichoic acid export membrane protein
MRGTQSLKLGAVAQMLPLAAGYGFNLLATPFVVSQLGLRDFGIWAITGAIAQYASLFDLGVSRATTRYVALYHAQEDYETERTVVGICVSVLAALGAVLIAIPLLIPGLLERVLGTGDPGLAGLLVLCAAVMLTFGLLARALAAASFGRGRMVAANVGLAILTAGQVFGGVIGLLIEPNLRHFALGTAAGSAIGFFVVIAAILLDERRIVIGKPSRALAKEMIAFGVKGQASGAADIAIFQSGKIIAGVVIGPAAAGAYELGSRLALGAQAFGSAASVALTAHLTRAFAAGGLPAIMTDYSRLTRRNAAVAIFLPLLLSASAICAIPVWLGEQNTDVVAVVMALGIAISVNVATGVCSATIFALGRTGLLAKTAIVEAVVSIVVAIPLALTFGFGGIIAAYAACILLGNILGVWYLQAKIGISIIQFLRAIAGPFAVGALAFLVTLPIGIYAAPQDRASGFVALAASFAVFAGIYLALGWRLDYLPRVRRTTAPQSESALP